MGQVIKRACKGYRLSIREKNHLASLGGRCLEFYTLISEFISKTDGYFCNYDHCREYVSDTLKINRIEFDKHYEQISHLFDKDKLFKFNIITSESRQKSFMFCTKTRVLVEIVKDYFLLDLKKCWARPRKIKFITADKHKIHLKRVRKSDSKVLKRYIDERIKSGAVQRNVQYKMSVYRRFREYAYGVLKSAKAFLAKIDAIIFRKTPACPIKQKKLDDLFYEKIDSVPDNKTDCAPPEMSFLEKMKMAGKSLKEESKKAFSHHNLF